MTSIGRPAQLPLGDALEPGPLEVVRLDRALSRGAPGQQAFVTRAGAPGPPSDLDPELHGPPFGIPAGVLGEGKEHGDCAPD